MDKKYTEEDIGKQIDKPERNNDTGKKWIMLSLSNDAIKFIKSAVNFYEGDKDDPYNEQIKEEVRKFIHNTWKELNPS